MKTLIFNELPSNVLLVGKMAADITPGMTDKEFLEKEIKKWLTSPERDWQIAGDAYYDGKHDILHRERMVIDEGGKLVKAEYLPNNKVVDNQYAKMVDQKTNYLLGKPFIFDTENKLFADALSAIFTRKVRRLMRRAGLKSLTGGCAWIFPYYNSEGIFNFAIFPAHEVLPFWADTEHTDLDCAVHAFPVYTYKNNGDEEIVIKIEVIHGGGIERFIWDNGSLETDPDAQSGSFVVTIDKDGNKIGYNWEHLPLVCFKSNEKERPLLCRIKSLQDTLNLLMSDFANNMEEDVHNTVLVLHNYDGEDLGEFRRNLAAYGAVKVSSVDGIDGGVDTLSVTVNADNYKTILELTKKAIIENARGYDARDDRMGGTPNQMNIMSMYSDIDLDANGMETEFQAAFEELLWFVKVHLKNSGVGDFMNEDVNIIFNRDILINEGEAIDNIAKSEGVISDETRLKQHPWVDDPVKELEKIKTEKEQAVADIDTYRNAFTNGKKTADGDGTNDGDGEVDEQ